MLASVERQAQELLGTVAATAPSTAAPGSSAVVVGDAAVGMPAPATPCNFPAIPQSGAFDHQQPPRPWDNVLAGGPSDEMDH
eukprot:6242892-Pyramimonas_sp.AAC.1